MKLPIYYDELEQEFINDITLEERTKKYIDKYFYPIRTIAVLANVYLLGGAIRDLMYSKKPKDLDFIVLNNENKEWILEVLKRYEINYTHNKFEGLKINYNGTIIDIWTSDNLYSAMEYNVDGLYYDVNNNTFINFTFDDFLENGLKRINPNNNIENGREEKLKEFELKIRIK